MSEILTILSDFIVVTMKVFGGLFILATLALLVWIIITYIIDITQTQQTIRRNYPVIGRFRYFFEHLG